MLDINTSTWTTGGCCTCPAATEPCGSWAVGRHANGTIKIDDELFPEGIKPVADYIHSKGMLFGIYTARGSFTCMGRPGSDGHEQLDAEQYAQWGVDYLKEDSCGGAVPAVVSS